MSTTGRAVDLLTDWKAHAADCTLEHGWGDDGGIVCRTSAGDVVALLRELFDADPVASRDVTLSEAQEAVHVGRYDHRTQTPEGRTPVGGPDSFYNGVRHAESIIRGLRGGDPSALAIERVDLERKLEEANAELARLRTRVGQLTAAHAEAERLRAAAGSPHSRACGIRLHEHGSSCAPDCPTCHGPLHPTRGDQ